VIQNDDRLRIGTVPLGGSLIRTDALEGAVLGGGMTHSSLHDRKTPGRVRDALSSL